MVLAEDPRLKTSERRRVDGKAAQLKGPLWLDLDTEALMAGGERIPYGEQTE